MRPGKTPSEIVCKLQLNGNMWRTDDFTILLISDKMTINFNVLYAFMKDDVLCDVNSTCIVRMKRSMIELRKTKLCQ